MWVKVMSCHVPRSSKGRPAGRQAGTILGWPTSAHYTSDSTVSRFEWSALRPSLPRPAAVSQSVCSGECSTLLDKYKEAFRPVAIIQVCPIDILIYQARKWLAPQRRNR